MNDILPQLICAHLVGDFILQNHEMAKLKAIHSDVCWIHVMVYLLPISLVVWLFGLPILTSYCLVAAIGIQHFLQDRFQLHLKWMKFYGQTPPELWSTGPLCVDQAWHIAFLWLFSTLL